jgi:hypothetical protein
MNLKEQRGAALRSAQAIIGNAKASDRDVTASEAQTVEALFASIDDLDVKIRKSEESAVIMAKINSLGGPGYDGDDDESAGMFTEEQKSGLVSAIRSKG